MPFWQSVSHCPKIMRQKDSIRPVAPIFVQEAVQCGHGAGVPMEQLLQDLGLSSEDLWTLNTNDFGRIWLTLSLKMQDEFFGLGARPMRPGSTTLLGHSVRTATTFETALNRTLRFLRVVLDEPYGIVDLSGRDCTVRLMETGGPRSAFAYRAFFLILHGFNCWTAKERIPIKSITFPCAEPTATNDYGDFFGVPVRFDAEAATLTFDRAFLSRPAGRTDKELKVFLRSLPEAFLRGYRDNVGLKQRIINTCLNGPAADWPDAAGVAQRLGMSRSTLHRLMTIEGHSLTKLKEEQRRNRAVMLLSRTDKPIADIADAVGYADESTFYRAFARWFSTTPNAFRTQGSGAR